MTEEKKSEIVKKDTLLPADVEKVLIKGDLKELTPEQRISFYNHLCDTLSLNPATKPFEYILLDGKLTLYANKNCAEQLRKLNGISITRAEIKRDTTCIRVIVEGSDKTGRTDVEMGVVPLLDKYGKRLTGDRLANAEMKAMTKAKRRLTFSLCGLGMMDETELETIEPQRIRRVEIVDGEVVKEEPVAPADEPKSAPAPKPKPQAKPIPAEIPVCPVCGAAMTAKAAKSGHIFWSCPNYPECTQAKDVIPGAKNGETTVSIQKFIWETAVKWAGGDMDKAKQILMQDYGVNTLNLPPKKLAEVFNSIMLQVVSDSNVVSEGFELTWEEQSDENV